MRASDSYILRAFKQLFPRIAYNKAECALVTVIMSTTQYLVDANKLAFRLQRFERVQIPNPVSAVLDRNDCFQEICLKILNSLVVCGKQRSCIASE